MSDYFAYLWNSLLIFHAVVLPFSVLTAVIDRRDYLKLVQERERVGAMVAWYSLNAKVALGCAGAVAGFFGVVFGATYLVKLLII